MPCGGSLFSITSKSPWDSDSGAHDVVVGVRMRLQVTLVPCGGSLFSITSKSPWDSDSGAHDVVVGVRMRLQVNSDISDKLAV